MNGGDRLTFDTNILVYAVDADAGERHDIARRLVLAGPDYDCILTLQALAEFYHAVSRKQRMPAADAADLAMETVRAHGLSFWDAMLWACAREAGCTVILSGDFEHGRTLGGVRFHDPFTEPFAFAP